MGKQSRRENGNLFFDLFAGRGNPTPGGKKIMKKSRIMILVCSSYAAGCMKFRLFCCTIHRYIIYLPTNYYIIYTEQLFDVTRLTGTDVHILCVLTCIYFLLSCVDQTGNILYRVVGMYACVGKRFTSKRSRQSHSGRHRWCIVGLSKSNLTRVIQIQRMYTRKNW